jgi:hypothetical protein
MSQEIPVLLDPSLGVSTTDLQAAWDADPEAKQLGNLEVRPSGQQFTGFVELVVIPFVVALGAGVATEVVKDPVKEAVKKTIEVTKRLLASKAKVAVTVEQQSLPNGKEAVLVQKK